jgi:hypothetical protein
VEGFRQGRDTIGLALFLKPSLAAVLRVGDGGQGETGRAVRKQLE